HLLGRRIDCHLAGNEYESVGLDGLRVRADSLRSVFGGNNFAHESSSQLSVCAPSKTKPQRAQSNTESFLLRTAPPSDFLQPLNFVHARYFAQPGDDLLEML